MRLNLYLIPLLILSLCFCSEPPKKTESIPADILDKEHFAKLLCDFALAESAANSNVKGVSLAAMDSVYAFNPLIEDSVSRAQYDSTVKYYSQHPFLYKEVYALVLEKLSELEAQQKGTLKDSLSVKTLTPR